MKTKRMTTTALVNYYGTDRMIADAVAQLLKGCSWVGVPFLGGAGALARIPCQQGLASDLHRHVINLAQVVSDPEKRAQMMERIVDLPAHEEIHALACERCMARETDPDYALGDVAWAADYFVVSWMGRGSTCGTDGEFDSSISIRWKAGGGGSSQRWRSAIDSLDAWGDVLKRWVFIVLDAFDFIEKVRSVDAKAFEASKPLANGLYIDTPFPDAGDLYKHKFTVDHHRRMAGDLLNLHLTRCVVRFHDHPLVRELYSPDHWTYHQLVGRDQANGEKSELLLVRNGLFYA